MGETKLKPCPFCGADASAGGVVRYGQLTVAAQRWDQDEFYYCNCPSCGVNNLGLVGHRTRDEAIAAWNRRASHEARIAELEEALRVALPYVEQAIKDDGGIDNCDIGDRLALEQVRAALHTERPEDGSRDGGDWMNGDA